MNHGFYWNVEECRPFRNPLRHLPSPDQLLVQRVRTGGLTAPFSERINETVGSAHHTQVTIPLALRVKFGVLAIAVGFPRANQHRDFPLCRAVDAHTALQQAYSSVQ